MTLSTEPPCLPLHSSRWWHCSHRDPSAPIRLWCFPFTGSGAAVWQPWTTRLRQAAEIVTACLPGREGRLDEAPFTRMDELVAAFADELASVLDARDVFWGHCFGGLLAFELVRRLRAIGAPTPRALIVSGVRAPHLPAPRRSLHPLSPREFVPAVERRYGAIPPELRDRPEFLEQLLFTLRADLEIDETYRYRAGEPLDVPVLALGGRNDPLVPSSAIVEWRAHTWQRCETELLPGGHFFINEQPDLVSERIRSFLAAF